MRNWCNDQEDLVLGMFHIKFSGFVALGGGVYAPFSPNSNTVQACENTRDKFQPWNYGMPSQANLCQVDSCQFVACSGLLRKVAIKIFLLVLIEKLIFGHCRFFFYYINIVKIMVKTWKIQEACSFIGKLSKLIEYTIQIQISDEDAANIKLRSSVGSL